MPQLEAHITKVEHDVSTGWYRISTDGDPKRMDTKIREKAEEAAQLRKDGVLARIEYSENPRTVDGRTYRNARYERATASTNGSSGIDQIQETQRPKDPDTEWRIHLQTGAKLAVATLPYLPDHQRGFESQKQIAVAWADFFQTQQRGETPARGVDWEPDVPGGQPDDDIPF